MLFFSISPWNNSLFKIQFAIFRSHKFYERFMHFLYSCFSSLGFHMKLPFRRFIFLGLCFYFWVKFISLQFYDLLVGGCLNRGVDFWFFLNGVIFERSVISLMFGSGKMWERIFNFILLVIILDIVEDYLFIFGYLKLIDMSGFVFVAS